MNQIIRVFLFFLLGIFFFSCSEKNKKTDYTKNRVSQNNENILPEDISKIPSLPPLGKWMYTSDYTYANWLNEKIRGKTLREPINIIIIDSLSKSVDEAKNILISNFETAGFKIRPGHSGGYTGYIENKFYTQLPDKPEHSFSDEPFELNNCHGRIFGPCIVNGIYYFTGAFSKEKVVAGIPIHHYFSFCEARNKLAENLNLKTKYKMISNVDMFNGIETDSLTTGDHDSRAILLSLIK
jgi:hypothetical protein